MRAEQEEEIRRAQLRLARQKKKETELRAQLAAAQSNAQADRDEVRRSGVGRSMGSLFRACVRACLVRDWCMRLI